MTRREHIKHTPPVDFDTMMVEVTGGASCPICGPKPARLFTRSNGRDVLRCGCALLFSSPRPSNADIRAHFENEYIAGEQRVEIDFVSLRERTLRSEAQIVKALHPGGGRLLDIGAASGAFLRCFAGDPSWSAEGVEPSHVAARYAQERVGVTVRRGFLQDQRFPDHSFTVVTSLDSFYFHPNPNEDLAEIARILLPGGTLVVEIPGLKFRLLKNTGLICRLLYGEQARLNARLHLYFYSARTLGLLAARHGFVLERAIPQQGPIYGPPLLRIANRAFFLTVRTLYRLTRGRVNLVPKELLVFRLQH